MALVLLVAAALVLHLTRPDPDSPPHVAVDGAATEPPRHLRVASWNTFGLPAPAGLFTARTDDVLAYLRETVLPHHDVVCLQETWYHRGAIVRLLREQGGWTVVVPCRARFPAVVDSGLMIASRVPVVGLRGCTFQACRVSDCLAAKGAMVVTLRGGAVVGTVHTQDAAWDVDGEIRARQRAQAVELAAGALLVGDWNAPPGAGDAAPPEPTHASGRTLDYAVGGGAGLRVAVLPGGEGVSDHRAIGTIHSMVP